MLIAGLINIVNLIGNSLFISCSSGASEAQRFRPCCHAATAAVAITILLLNPSTRSLCGADGGFDG